MYRLMMAMLLLGACAGESGAGADEDVTPPIPLTAQRDIPFPPDLFMRGIEGEVLLYVVVDSSGAVIRDSTRIAKSSGQVEFDAAAMAAAPALQFTPAARNGVPIIHPIQVPIRFTIPDSLRVPEDTNR
jgi:TonB family protein